MTEDGRALTIVPEDIEDSFFSSRIESFWMLVWKRFKKHKLAMGGATVLIVLILSLIHI